MSRPIVAMATTAERQGYWLVASDGGIFSFNAPFYGALTGWPLAQPVTGMTATPSGHGYWIVTADGSVFPFGDAKGYGSLIERAPERADQVAHPRAAAARATGCTRPTAACSRSAPRASTVRPVGST